MVLKCLLTYKTIYIQFHEQAVYARGTKMKKKAYLMSIGNIAMWLYHSLTESETTFLNDQRTEERKVEKVGFLFNGIATIDGYLMPKPSL